MDFKFSVNSRMVYCRAGNATKACFALQNVSWFTDLGNGTAALCDLGVTVTLGGKNKVGTPAT